MNIALRQPSMHRLEHWLDHRPDKFERYLVAHPEVADVFERSNPLAGAAETLRATLDAAIAAPLDLAARMRERILEANHETSTAAVVLDLAASPPQHCGFCCRAVRFRAIHPRATRLPEPPGEFRATPVLTRRLRRSGTAADLRIGYVRGPPAASRCPSNRISPEPMKWLIALGILAAGVVLGSVVSGQVRRVVSKPSRPERTRALAQPLGGLAFSLLLAVALIAALGVVDEDALATMPTAIIAFVPKALVCTLTILLGQVVASVVSTAVGTSMIKATGKPQNQAVRAIKSLITLAFGILGVSQLGINTRIVDTLVQGLVFGTALSLALLTGFGGRRVAAEVAAGRYLRRILQVGDHIDSGAEHRVGTVSALHGATVELAASAEGNGDKLVIVHVPNTELLERELRITRDRPPQQH